MEKAREAITIEVAKRIIEEAREAGRNAGNGHTPQEMVVEQHSNPLNDGSPVVKSWRVPEGVCGFAWVRVKGKGRGLEFIRALKKVGLAGDINSYAVFTKSSGESGYVYWVHDHNQSYERKMKNAEAFAEVLREYDINAYASGRLD